MSKSYDLVKFVCEIHILLHIKIAIVRIPGPVETLEVHNYIPYSILAAIKVMQFILSSYVTIALLR